MANLSLAFQLSASAVGMSQGINAGVVELQKLGLAAKKTAADIAILKTLEISRAFISSVSAIANTFQSFTSGALSSIDATRQLSESLGVSFGELRQLQVAADLSGASTEDLARAFTRAQLTITKAAGGSTEAKAALAALGLSVDDLAKQTTTQQFASIAQAISQIPDPAQRAAAAVAIFGRNGAALLPTFRELPENLKTAQQFLDGFKGGLNNADAAKIDAISDSFSLAGQAIKELAGKILVELQPALTRGAQDFVKYLQGIDVPKAARSVNAFLSDLASILAVVARFAAPLAENIFPAIGGYLAFINRQIITSGISSLAKYFSAAAAAAFGYTSAAGAATAANAALAVSVRALLTSTGIGALVVLFGVAAGALIEWSIAGKSAGADVQEAVDEAKKAVERFTEEARNAGNAATDLGEKIKLALRVPEQITVNEIAQGSLDEARAAIVALARELGGLDQVPDEVLATFREISEYAGRLDESIVAQTFGIQQVDTQSRALISTVNRLREARKAEAEASRAAADASLRAAEDARRRTTELASQGMPAAETARVQLNKDLLAIQLEQANAEKALEEARKRGDNAAIEAANVRLGLIQAAREAAIEENRQRQLEALGIDRQILAPAQTLADQFRGLRDAAQRGLVDPDQFQLGLRNLADEGIRIRREIAAELSRPANNALEVQDIRTQQGQAQFQALAQRREDPAIEQRREQISKLEEIRRGLRAIAVNPVDIIG